MAEKTIIVSARISKKKADKLKSALLKKSVAKKRRLYPRDIIEPAIDAFLAGK